MWNDPIRDGLHYLNKFFDEFIEQQLAKPDEPETDHPIVHADIGYGVADASN